MTLNSRVNAKLWALLILVMSQIIQIKSDDFTSCPTPTVKKRTIIRSEESIKRGARLITKNVVDNAKDCYELCCNDASCNVAIMHYKEEKNEYTDKVYTYKYCFLFDCGKPGLCTYEYNRRYAVIDLGFKHKSEVVTTEAATTTLETTTTTPPTTTTEVPTTTTSRPSTTIASVTTVEVKVPQTTTTRVSTTKDVKGNDSCPTVCSYLYEPLCGDDGHTYDNKCLFKIAKCKLNSLKIAYDGECNECPPGVPMSSCSDDPCKITSCPNNKEASCKANFCGGCNAVYYGKDGKKVNCTTVETSTCKTKALAVPKGLLGAYIPQCKADGSFEEKQCHASTGNCWCVNSETGVELSGTRKTASDGEVSCGVAELEKDNEVSVKVDPSDYEQDPEDETSVTNIPSSEASDPYFNSERRTYINETGPCHVKLSSIPKNIVGAFIPQCKVDGTYDEKQCHSSSGNCWCVNPITGDEIQGTRKGPTEGDVACGVSNGVPVVYVVQEHSMGSILSLPLLIALIICVVLLIGVIYRVKCMGQRRGKKLPVDDGDYLINGMYL